MKNLFKISALALTIAISVLSCDPAKTNSAKEPGDTAKKAAIDTSKKTAIDTVKKDTSKKQ